METNILESPYYGMNKFLLTCIGQWPYQKALYKNLLRFLYASAVGGLAIPQVYMLLEVWGRLDHVIDCVSILAVRVATTIKFLNYIFNADKIKKLLNHIQNDWNSDIFQPQLQVFKEYALEGKKLTKLYGVCMYTTLVMFVIMPAMPILLNVVKPLNVSRPVPNLVPVKYGNLDMEKYYLPIFFHTNVASFFVVTSIVAMDTTYTVYVQHACGMFAVLGDRLKNLMDSDEDEFLDEVNASEREEATYRSIVECIKIHKRTIEFAGAIESVHVIVFFFVLGLSVMCMSLAGYQMIVSLDTPTEAIRFGVFTLGQVAHIFFISWPGQKLIDHSELLYDWVYAAKWYKASSRSKQLLMIMMMRSIEPCKLTAGKFYEMSLTNFSMVMRASMSYFTMLTSFR